MPKAALKPPLTEPTIPMAGQPSAGLLAELRQAGTGLTTAHIGAAMAHLDATQARFVTEAVATGLLIEAKRQTLKHGEFQRFAAEVWRENGQSGNAVSTLPGALNNFTRSMRGYAFLARHFLADLEQNNFQPDGELATKPAIVAAEALALIELGAEKRIAVYAAIERFAAGRSLRRLLMDFRRAESAAHIEELTEEPAHPRKPGQRDDDPAQLTFFADLKGALTVLDTLLESPELKTHATHDQLMRMADALEAHAKALRAQAKETRA